ncbi:hypothetical protein QQM39_38995 [Streptomyces sp. DT2A-34]|uniref:hypothetical protein n=1 Tax=Streptomyces sp. DT2A-34 TaxID=3051182 RepID=UPI00265C1CD3|nr:hypothetical protein [Streptomyces sp. DT2A-34]MDO0916598.1 hypothetical protein [Streptomyces sp. DT2A-34]
MWTDDEMVAAGHSIDLARWREAFAAAMGRIAGRFARYEPRVRAGRLLLGLLSDLPRKNCWTIAEWADPAHDPPPGPATPAASVNRPGAGSASQPRATRCFAFDRSASTRAGTTSMPNKAAIF